MRSMLIRLGVAGIVIVAGSAAPAGWPCRACGGVGGMTYDGPACGPRVHCPAHEPVGPIDQCDACARFAGCEGYRQMPEMLAPWQLPPGRGFRPPEAFGYEPASCEGCAACGPRWGWPRAW